VTAQQPAGLMPKTCELAGDFRMARVAGCRIITPPPFEGGSIQHFTPDAV